MASTSYMEAVKGAHDKRISTIKRALRHLVHRYPRRRRSNSSRERSGFYIGDDLVTERQYWHYVLNLFLGQSVATARYAADLELDFEQRLEAGKPIMASDQVSNSGLLERVENARMGYLALTNLAEFNADSEIPGGSETSMALTAVGELPQRSGQSSSHHSARRSDDHEQAAGSACHVECVEKAEAEEEPIAKPPRRLTFVKRFRAWRKHNWHSRKHSRWGSEAVPGPLPQFLAAPPEYVGEELCNFTQGQLELMIKTKLQPWLARGGQAEFETRFSANFEEREKFFDTNYPGRRVPSSNVTPPQQH